MPIERFGFQESPEIDPFEEQFDHIGEVRLPRGTAEVADFSPRPEEAKDEVPVYVGSAWGMGIKTYMPLMKQICKDGRRVLSTEHPSYDDALDSSMNVKELWEKNADRKEKYPTAELRKALNMLEVLEEKGIKQVDAIAHSEGALNVAMAAAMYPEKFRTITFFGPAGMLENETWARLIGGFLDNKKGPRTVAPETLHDIPITEDEREVGAAAGEDFVRYFVKNTRRAISEVVAIKQNHSRLKDLIPYLHSLGINIVVMSAEGDAMFPPEQVRKAADMDAVDSFISVPGGHGMVGEHPEIIVPIIEAENAKFAKKERTAEQKQALADREYHAGVRYIPGEGLKISEYVKRGE